MAKSEFNEVNSLHTNFLLFSYIQFCQELTFDDPSTLVFFELIRTYTFKCNYKSSTSTEIKKFGEEAADKTQRTRREVEKFVAWDNGMKINFYSDATFTKAITPISLIVGERFFIALPLEC